MSIRLQTWICAVTALGLAACTAESPVAPAEVAVSFNTQQLPPTRTVKVCKVGLDEATRGRSFTFLTEATAETIFVPQAFLTALSVVDFNACVKVWRGDHESPPSVTVTELPLNGFVLESVELINGTASEELTVTHGGVTIAPALGVTYLVFKNHAESAVPGRMTGGGHQVRVDGVRITRGFTLHCDITLSNNLQINWPGGNKWHLEKENLESVVCIDDPLFDPVPPAAPFDTFIATALGSLNGVPGSINEFKLIDDGEPGRTDEAYFTIYAPNQGPGQVVPGAEVIVLQVGGQLDGGNVQAHYDQPHK